MRAQTTRRGARPRTLGTMSDVEDDSDVDDEKKVAAVKIPKGIESVFLTGARASKRESGARTTTPSRP